MPLWAQGQPVEHGPSSKVAAGNRPAGGPASKAALAAQGDPPGAKAHLGPTRQLALQPLMGPAERLNRDLPKLASLGEEGLRVPLQLDPSSSWDLDRVKGYRLPSPCLAGPREELYPLQGPISPSQLGTAADSPRAQPRLSLGRGTHPLQRPPPIAPHPVWKLMGQWGGGNGHLQPRFSGASSAATQLRSTSSGWQRRGRGGACMAKSAASPSQRPPLCPHLPLPPRTRAKGHLGNAGSRGKPLRSPPQAPRVGASREGLGSESAAGNILRGAGLGFHEAPGLSRAGSGEGGSGQG